NTVIIRREHRKGALGIKQTPGLVGLHVEVDGQVNVGEKLVLGGVAALEHAAGGQVLVGLAESVPQLLVVALAQQLAERKGTRQPGTNGQDRGRIWLQKTRKQSGVGRRNGSKDCVLQEMILAALPG